MPRKKRNQKKVVQKAGAINSVERAIERMKSENILEYAKKLNRPVKYLLKNTHTGETTEVVIESNKHAAQHTNF